ncbi:S8 family peptidase [Actinoalloteichus caeruleus]|uniref:Subtilase family protein n=1 Tax=Actinoalloteichus caeruleus DSM 43889 TaxID=1120930 RepID=A0ABT1JFE8_ACTCY|nr:S8 family serine peptidase [Actinoalloteichus caeruleus]MCP2331215.1 Subtilase family protein [Actinoalloteichus caeruleus DSM 43889]
MRTPRVRLGAGLLAALLLTTPTAAAGTHETDPPPPTTPVTSHTNGAPISITLITGDTVLLRQGPDGLALAGFTSPPHRRGTGYHQETHQGRLVVIPDDARRAVISGRLDERFFDLTGLVEQGLTDDHQDSLRIIVDEPADGPRAFAAPEVAEHTQSFPDLGLRGLEIAHEDLPTFWQDLEGGDGPSVLSAQDDTRVLLDGRVRATLDQSRDLVGASEAWDAGHTGDGVTVAVLDTGYDTGHPDLDGRVVAAENFSDAEDVQDRRGHGTHVAATIAGTGAASDGRYAGVAPDADLVVAKVLDDQGQGWTTDIIAGAEWAVEQGADILNLSLAGWATPERDPLVEAVEELSATTGALFVVAAGNNGRPASIDSPGVADSALTVGSTTKQDELSDFSSQGPVPWNFGLKPEIAAPGSDIVAARAEGVEEEWAIDEHYLSASGTSMAAPHVAGAAALALQANPDLDGQQIKALLTGSAEPLPGIDVHGQGAGRLDIARALEQGPRAEPATLGFGLLDWPHDGEPVERTITYTNPTDTELTLDLDLTVSQDDGTPAPDGLLELTTNTVTVPPGQTATATLVLRPTAERVSTITGRLTATTNGARLVTPVSAVVDQERHQLAVSVSDEPLTSSPLLSVVAENTETGELHEARTFEEGVDVTLVPGTYRVVISLNEYMEDGRSYQTYAAEEVELTEDTLLDVPLETREAVALVPAEDDAERYGTTHGYVLESATHTFTGIMTELFVVDAGAEIDGLGFLHGGAWTAPLVRVELPGHDLRVGVWEDLRGPRGTVTGTLVDLTSTPAEDVPDLTGRIPFLSPGTDLAPDKLADLVRAVADRGAEVLLGSVWIETEIPLPYVNVEYRSATRLAELIAEEGRVEAVVEGRDHSPSAYYLLESHDGGLPPSGHRVVEADELARIENTYHNPGPEDVLHETRQSASSEGVVIADLWALTMFPQERTEYFSPGFDWVGEVSLPGDWGVGKLVTPPTALEAGDERTEAWYRGPIGPTLPDQTRVGLDEWRSPAMREDDLLRFQLSMFGDNDPRHEALPDLRFDTDSGRMVLSRDGEVVAEADTPGLADLEVPPGPGWYDLAVDAERDHQVWAAPGRVHGQWRFHSTGADEVLPLLDIRYDLPLGLTNDTPAGEPLAGTATVVHQTGAQESPINELAVEASFDEGETWVPAEVDRDGEGWTLVLPGAGEPGDLVWLRATANDEDGNSVTETIEGAYRLH